MKKIYSLIWATCFTLSASAQDVVPKLSPLTKAYLSDVQHLTGNKAFPGGYVYKKRNDGRICVSAIIKINRPDEDKVQQQLTGINATVGTKAGSIWTVQLPVENVEAFTHIKGIIYIQLDEPVAPQLDVARKMTRVDSAHGGFSLPRGYSGKDVIVGVIDFGFDYNHPTVYDTSGNRYRIVKAWEMNGSGTPPAGYSYGHELTDSFALKAQGTDNPVQTHGTGVAGLAAGSGFGSPEAGKFRGVAYESDMVLVGVRRDSIGGQWLTGGFSDFIDGVSYLMNYAKSAGKPIVVNISWGSHSGPHDGSSLVNQAFDTLSGPGRIIVMSAGNEGGNALHLDKAFTATDTALHTFLYFTSNGYKRTWIDIWGDTGKTFCVNTTLYSKGVPGNMTGRICIDNMTRTDTLIGANGIDTCYVQTITSSSEYNNKPRVTINIFNKASDSVGISVHGTSGKVNLWNEYYYYGYTYGFASSFSNLSFPWATSGNTNTTISDMGAAKSTLLVGAYNSKTLFIDINGNPQNYPGRVAGRLASFSSRGPYIDGRIKPDITAPGFTIATSVNSWDTSYSETGSSRQNTVSKYTHPVSGKGYYYGEFSGTSASSPLAAGIVALLLEADPTLTPERVNKLIAETAIQDFYTGTLPAAGTNLWGHGKINAYGALRQLLTELSVISYTGTQKLDCVIFPNPSRGQFTLDYQGSSPDQLRIDVVDISGKSVYTQTWKVMPGQNSLALDLSAYAKGIYFVNVLGLYGGANIKTIIQ